MHELGQFQRSAWGVYLTRLPVLMFGLEMLSGFFKSTTTAAVVTAVSSTSPSDKSTPTPSPPSTPPSPPHPALAAIVPAVSSLLQSLVVSLASTLSVGSHAHSLTSEACIGIMRAIFSCLLCEAIAKSMTHTQWTHAVSQLRRMCDPLPSMRGLLGDVLVGLAGVVRVPNDAIGTFFQTIEPLFHFLLTPVSGVDPTVAFESFYRLSVTCGSMWTPRLKDLIPPTVHPQLVAYVKSRGKSKPTTVDSGPTVRPLMINSSSAASIQADVTRLESEATKQQQLSDAFAANPNAIRRRQERLHRLHATVSHASAALQEVQIEIEQAAVSMNGTH
jgi:hypothetical protein